MPWRRASIRQGHHRSKQQLLHLGLPAPAAPSHRPYAASRTPRSLDSPATRSPSSARGVLPPRCSSPRAPVLQARPFCSSPELSRRRPVRLPPPDPSGPAVPDLPRGPPRLAVPVVKSSRDRRPLHPLLRAGGRTRVACDVDPSPCCLGLSSRSAPRPSRSLPAPPPTGPCGLESTQIQCPLLYTLRFHSGVVRIRSTTSVCLLQGLVLLPCGISGTDDTSAGDATKLKWEFNEELGRYYVLFPDDQ